VRFEHALYVLHWPSRCRGARYEVRLAVAVNRLMESRRPTQAAAATALSINQPKISALNHYKLEGFSVERLMTFLTALGSDIEIRVHLPKRSSSPGRILVNAA
jgi:predicted XRE-type DNA-binding protein